MTVGDTTLAALEARLARLEDIEAVRETWLDYCTQIDLAAYDRLGDVFARTPSSSSKASLGLSTARTAAGARSSTTSTGAPPARRTGRRAAPRR